MKKKIIIAIIAITLLVAAFITTITVNQTNLSINGYNLKQYIYDPVSILDNKIDAGDTYILPFIFGSTGERLKENYLKEEFAKANLTIETISSKKLGTGTIIKTVEEEKPYQILIYGDVDGDGRIGLSDSQIIIEYYLNSAAKPLTGVNYTAANVSNKDNKVNLTDAQRIVDFYIENVDTLLSNPPTDDIVKGIEVISPNKLVYNYGEELDLTGAKVQRVTTSGIKCTPENISLENVKGYDKEKAGIQELSVEYAGYTAKLTVKVLEPITSLEIDESCKSEDISTGKQIVLGVISQGEGQSSLNKENLKTKVVSSDENASEMKVSYKFRSEVFKDYTEENKNDIIIVAQAEKAGNYEVTSYLGDEFDTATAKSNTVMVEVANKSSISEIEIDGTLQIICKESLEGVDISKENIYTETKKVAGEDKTIHYVLKPVKFKDQNGEYKTLNVTDFEGYGKGVAYKLTISDNYGFNIPGLEAITFRKDSKGNPIKAGGENTFEYIGFAPVHNVDVDSLNGGIVTITYGPANLVNAVSANLKVEVIK